MWKRWDGREGVMGRGAGKREAERRPVEGSTMMKKAAWQAYISRLHFVIQCISIQQQQPFDLSLRALAISYWAVDLICMLLTVTTGHVELFFYYYNTLNSSQRAFDFLGGIVGSCWMYILVWHSPWIHLVSSLLSLERYSLRQPSNECRMLATVGIHLLVSSTLFTSLPL